MTPKALSHMVDTCTEINGIAVDTDTSQENTPHNSPLTTKQICTKQKLKDKQQLVPTPAALLTNSTMAQQAARIHGIVSHENMLRPLHCVAQDYAWGRLGSSSTVARMKDAQAMQEDDSKFTIDETLPYAELWLGTHPSGMSQVTVHLELQQGFADAREDTASVEGSLDGFFDLEQDEPTVKRSLLEYVQSNPELHCGNAEMTDLSFLLKVLSVRKVLSIQAHPDRALAEILHKEQPHNYKDPNHKPEMAIALSEHARAMCGFRPLSEVAQHLQEYPEFRTLLGEVTAKQIEQAAATDSEDAKQLLRTMFYNYLKVPNEIMNFLVERMVTRLKTLEHAKHTDIQKLILQLQEQFPGDCGIFAPLIFNILELSQGEGLFIGANEPHAYISGEILECMACSDNVVRAGLTPKHKDIDTLVQMLTYKCCHPQLTSGDVIDECTVRYCPPVPDFCIEIVTVAAGQVYELQPVNSPAVLLTLDGEASLNQADICSMDVSFGSAAFFSANTTCTIQAGPYGVRLTRSFTNVYYQEE